MFRFFESIRSEHNSMPLLDYHQDRMDRCFKIYYRSKNPFQLSNILAEHTTEELYKIKCSYTKSNINIEKKRYHKKQISSLVIKTSNISYALKFCDRSALIALTYGLPAHSDIIIAKAGEITDSSYSNLVFKTKNGLITPSNYLLAGVQRRYLLEHKRISEESIDHKELNQFEGVYLINAMMNLEEAPYIPIENVIL